MSDDIKKRDITSLIEKEAPNLNNLLEPEDVSIFKEMTGELRDTWTKKQMFRTQTEMEFSVLNDAKYLQMPQSIGNVLENKMYS